MQSRGRPASSSRCSLALRRGATIIELLVALVLFDMALLTLVAVSAVAVRRIGEAGRRNRAAISATIRIESFTAEPCGPASLGQATLERGVVERWSSAPIAGGRELVDSVRIEAGVTESLVLRARIAC